MKKNRTTETEQTLNTETSASALSVEALTSGNSDSVINVESHKTLADDVASSMRMPIRFVKQPGRDEFGNRLFVAPKTVIVEKDGKQIETTEKQFKAFLKHKGYTIVQVEEQENKDK